MNKKTKGLLGLILAVVLVIVALIGYNATHQNIKAGYVGYMYDRTLKAGNERCIEGTSVIDKAETGRVAINPFTQELYIYPTVMVERAWTNNDEGDEDKMQAFNVATKEGENVTMDIYFSVRPDNVGKLISAYGGRDFDSIVDQNFLGLVKGKLSSVTQSVSVYDIQNKRSEIQEKVFAVLGKELSDTYGVKLTRFEIGTATPSDNIQAKIREKTDAINAVELAKLSRQKQDQENAKVVDKQKADSERDVVKREADANAKAYEAERAAEALVTVANSEKLQAEIDLEIAKLAKLAKLEEQKAFTPQYFKDRQLDNEALAMNKINPTLKTIIAGDASELMNSIIGAREALNVVN